MTTPRADDPGEVGLTPVEFDPFAEIVPVPRTGELPLSYSQERLWFLEQLDLGGATYNLPVAVRLTGALDRTALARSLAEMVGRHETLRTTFTPVDGRPVQAVGARGPVSLAEVDLRSFPGDREEEARRLVSEAAWRPFDLARGPLFRALLIRLEEDVHVFLHVMHHIISDAWSAAVLTQEMGALYRSFATGEPPSLPALPIQYPDYALWQRQWLQGPVLEEQLAYWRERMGGELPVLELPCDHPRPPLPVHRGRAESLDLPEPLREALQELSRREGVTLFMTMLAAFKALLLRYTGQKDILVGTPIANRNHGEVEGLIGFFLNTLVLRTDLGGDPSFRELLSRVRETALGAYDHQELPFEMLMQELRPERDLHHTPLFQVFFNMIQATPPAGFPGLEVTPYPLPVEAAKFDLTFYLVDTGNRLTVSFSYDRDLFEPATMTRMLGHFHTLLESITSKPGEPLSRLGLETEAERRGRAEAIHPIRPAKPFLEFARADVERSIPARFDSVAARHAGSLAVKTRTHEWSYADLARAADQVAQGVANGCGSQAARIALLFDQGAPMIAGLLGVLRSGNSYVPLDPAYPRERLAQMLADSGAAAVVADRANLGLARELTGGSLPLIEAESQKDGAASSPPGPIPAETPAYILYTSGSTGRPKGVVQSHGNVLRHIRNYTNNLHIAADDRLILLASYSFDAAVMDVFGALLNGASLHPVDVRQEGLDGVARRVADEKITIYHSTPTVYRAFLSSLPEGARFPDMRLVVLGGEEVLRQDVDLHRRHFPAGCLFVNGLGPTESTLALQHFVDRDAELTGASVPVGYPVEDTEIVFLSDAGPSPVYGEIGIRSPQVALGYWGRPELTAAAFLPDPDGGDRRTYRTGDLGRLRYDGSIEFLGRKDHQVKIRGFRIELGEIEQALLRHPGVEKAVVAAKDAASGERRLVAYVIPRSGPSPTPAGLRDHLRGLLPAYMVPSLFVSLEAFPLTPTGKVDRAALPAAEDTATDERVAPRTPVEESLALLWVSLLGIEAVGVHDDFFARGGHSLLATQLASRVRDRFGVELEVRAVFEQPTLEGQARLIGEKMAQGSVPALPAIVALPRRARPGRGSSGQGAGQSPSGSGEDRTGE